MTLINKKRRSCLLEMNAARNDGFGRKKMHLEERAENSLLIAVFATLLSVGKVRFKET